MVCRSREASLQRRCLCTHNRQIHISHIVTSWFSSLQFPSLPVPWSCPRNSQQAFHSWAEQHSNGTNLFIYFVKISLNYSMHMLHMCFYCPLVLYCFQQACHCFKQSFKCVFVQVWHMTDMTCECLLHHPVPPPSPPPWNILLWHCCLYQMLIAHSFLCTVRHVWIWIELNF